MDEQRRPFTMPATARPIAAEVRVGLMDRVRGLARPQPPAVRDPRNEILAEAPARIAAVHKFEQPGETFTARLQAITQGADDLLKRHNALVEAHRAALTENEILRAQVAAEQDYSADLRAYWEERYAELEHREGRLARLYHGLTSRLDAIVEVITGARAETRAEALAREAPEQGTGRNNEPLTPASRPAGENPGDTSRHLPEPVFTARNPAVPLR